MYPVNVIGVGCPGCGKFPDSSVQSRLLPINNHLDLAVLVYSLDSTNPVVPTIGAKQQKKGRIAKLLLRRSSNDL